MSNVVPVEVNLKVGDEVHSLRYRFDLDKFSQNIFHGYLSKGRLYEPDLSMFVIRVLKKGDVFVDVGAHVGVFSILASKLAGPDGQVIAVEAERDNVDDLMGHVELNGCRNITVRNAVLSDSPGPTTFYTNADNDGGHCLWDPGRHAFNRKSAANPEPRTVEAETLDSIIGELKPPAIKILKMDTEGAEHLIVKGGLETIESYRIPFILSEMNDFGLQQLGSSQQAYRSAMKEIGYDTFLMDDQGGFPKLLPLSVPIQTRMVINVLYSTVDSLAPYWDAERIPWPGPDGPPGQP